MTSTELLPSVETTRSGQEWLPSYPDHWELTRMKSIFTERSIKGQPALPLLAATQSMGVVKKETYGQRTVVAQTGLENLKVVEVDDFVISLRSFEGGIEVAHDRGIISPAYTVLRVRDLSLHGYFRHLLKSRFFLDAIRLSVTGIREGQSINYSRLGCTFLPIPSADERRAIVRYLDHAEMRIARAIAGKRRVSALLAEHLAAIKEVCLLYGGTFETLGLVEGLENLGAISLATRPQPAGLMFREVRRKPNPGIPKLSLSMSRGLVRSRTVSQKGSELSSSLTYSMARRGDIVMNKYRAYLGAFAPCTEDGLITPNYTVLEPVMNLSAEFYALLFSTHAFQGLWRMKSKGVGDGMMPLYTNEFRRTRVPWYPLEVQQYRLDAYLGASESTRKALDAVELEIALLKEYRTRLISDVVTGKLDVRKEAASLPDVDPNELAEVLAGGATSTDEEEGADGDE